MKKTARIISMLLVIVTAVCALASCNPTATEGKVTVIVEKYGSFDAYEVELSDLENKSEGAVGVLEALGKRENNPLKTDMGEGIYGKYINSIGPLVPDASKNEYVCIYTSVEKDFDVSEWVKTKEYNGTTLKTSGLGISSLTVENGVILLFCIESY